MSIDAQVTAIQERIAAATRAAARAAHEYDAATAARDRAARELADQFGVTTVEEAQEHLAALREALAGELSTVRTALDAIGL